MDFMSSNLYNGRRFRVLNVLGSYSKDYLGYEVDTSINEYAAYWKELLGSKVCRK